MEYGTHDRIYLSINSRAMKINIRSENYFAFKLRTPFGWCIYDLLSMSLCRVLNGLETNEMQYTQRKFML